MTTSTQSKKAAAASKAAVKSTKLIGIDKVTTEEIVRKRWILAKFKVPAPYAKLLAPRGVIQTMSASVSERELEIRMQQWRKPFRLCDGEKTPSRQDDLRAILQMDRDTEVAMAIPAGDWPRMKAMCKKLGISVSDWILAAVQYNARVAMEELEAAKA